MKIFYIDEAQCAAWNQQLLDELPDDAAERKLLAARPEEWRAQPGFYYTLADADLEGPFATWDEAKAEAEDALKKRAEHRPPPRFQ